MSGLDVLIALRAAARDARYALVNLIGLSAAFAGALLIGLYVLYEQSYERWVPNAERIATVHSRFIVSGQEPPAILSAQFILAREIKGRIPGVERVGLVLNGEYDTKSGDQIDFQDYASVEPDFLRMIPFEAVEGDPLRAIEQPRTLVVTQSYAEKWLGAREGVLGRTIQLRILGEMVPFTVGAVIRDPAGPTHFNLPAMVKMTPADDEWPPRYENWGSFGGQLYLELAPGADLQAIQAALQKTFDDGFARQFAGNPNVSFDIEYGVARLLDLRLNTPELRADPRIGDKTFVLGLSGAGVLILVLAVANFAALSSAMAARRAKESALRRTLGATKRIVGLQFVAENMAIATASLAIGLGLLALGLPAFNAAMATEISLAPLLTPMGLAIVIALGLITGALAGLSPALSVARLDPARVLAGGGAGARGQAAKVRFAVVTAQYAISAALIAGALVTFAQVQHLANGETNFQPEGLVQIVGAQRAGADRLDALLAQLRATPGVIAVTAGAAAPVGGSHNSEGYQLPGKEAINLQRVEIIDNYFETFRTPVLAGRSFAQGRAEDDAAAGEDYAPMHNVVINETAARLLGFASPQEAVGQAFVYPHEMRIIGVVADQRFYSLQHPASGVVYLRDPRFVWLAAVRFEGVDQATAIARTQVAWRAIYPDLPVTIQAAETTLWDYYAAERRRTAALAGFSALAVVLAGLGAYALSAYSAERRGREMAIRRIVGADGLSVAGLHLRRAMLPAAIGASIAAPLAALAAERWLAGFDSRIDTAPLYAAVACIAVLALSALAASVEAAGLARQPPGQRLNAT